MNGFTRVRCPACPSSPTAARGGWCRQCAGNHGMWIPQELHDMPGGYTRWCATRVRDEHAGRVALAAVLQHATRRVVYGIAPQPGDVVLARLTDRQWHAAEDLRRQQEQGAEQHQHTTTIDRGAA